MKKIYHGRLISQAFRTALIFVSGFIIYEILIQLEKIWNKNVPKNRVKHFYQRKMYKFILVFIIDLIILYGIAVFLGIHH